MSLVIPAYNEEDGLPLLRNALEAWRTKQPWETDVIIVNDGSRDNTGRYLQAWAAESPWLKVVHLSRNFGQQAAITAGLDHADSDGTVIIDADLQYPLEVIGAMVERYCEGFDVVYGQRTNRHGETWAKRLTAWLFYRLMQRVALRSLPVDAGDFRLVSRRCLESVRPMRETHRFLRGMFSWVGFPQTAVPYVRQSRQAGTTKYPYRKMFHFAWNAMLSYSTLPLRLVLTQGLVLGGGGASYGIYLGLRWLFTEQTATGGEASIVLLSLVGGSILTSLGLIGEYISRIYNELQDRPLYVVAQTSNFGVPRPVHSDLPRTPEPVRG